MPNNDPVRSTTHDNEQRLVQACCLLVGRHVQQNLSVEKRGVVSSEFVRKRSRAMVMAALDGVVDELVAEIEKEVTIPLQVETPKNGRFSVMTNDQPCTRCQSTTRLAHHTYEVGALVRVECEECTPVGGQVV